MNGTAPLADLDSMACSKRLPASDLFSHGVSVLASEQGGIGRTVPCPLSLLLVSCAPRNKRRGRKINSHSVGHHLNRCAQVVSAFRTRACPVVDRLSNFTGYTQDRSLLLSSFPTSRTGLRGPTWAPKSRLPRFVDRGLRMLSVVAFPTSIMASLPVDMRRPETSSIRTRLSLSLRTRPCR